jgi:hypothetical protein
MVSSACVSRSVDPDPGSCWRDDTESTHRPKEQREDGKVIIALPVLHSHHLPPCKYSTQDDENTNSVFRPRLLLKRRCLCHLGRLENEQHEQDVGRKESYDVRCDRYRKLAGVACPGWRSQLMHLEV